jgi:signal peptidase
LQDKNSMTIPNKVLFEHVLEYIRLGKSVVIGVKGSSMKPFLREADRVVLEPLGNRHIKKGLIVLADWEGQIVLHRVVKIKGDSIYLAGDGNITQLERVKKEGVFAIAARLLDGDREVNLTANWRCYLGLFWYRVRPLRRIMMKIF